MVEVITNAGCSRPSSTTRISIKS